MNIEKPQPPENYVEPGWNTKWLWAVYIGIPAVLIAEIMCAWLTWPSQPEREESYGAITIDLPPGGLQPGQCAEWEEGKGTHVYTPSHALPAYGISTFGPGVTYYGTVSPPPLPPLPPKQEPKAEAPLQPKRDIPTEDMPGTIVIKGGSSFIDKVIAGEELSKAEKMDFDTLDDAIRALMMNGDWAVVGLNAVKASEEDIQKSKDKTNSAIKELIEKNRGQPKPKAAEQTP